MRTIHSACVATIALTLCWAAVASRAGAQKPAPRPASSTISLNVGMANWNRDAAMLSIRADRQLARPALLVEGSVGVLPGQGEGVAYRSVVPEVQLQLQLPRTVAPYLGLGAGAYTYSDGSQLAEVNATASVAVGVRVRDVRPGTLLRTELRARSIGSSVEGGLELTAGMGWVF